jgi:MFS family permease
VSNNTPSNVRYYVLVFLLVITAINYIQRNCIGPAYTTIEKEIGITGPQLDLAGGAFFLAYALAQVPSGVLSQKIGPRLALTLFAASWSLVTLACAFAVGFWDLYIYRLLLGVLQAGIFPCATLILAVWYPVSQRGFATASLNSFMLIGGAAQTMLTGVLLGPIGWRMVFILYAIPGLIWAVVFYLWFRDRPEEHTSVNEQELALLREGKQTDKAIPPNVGDKFQPQSPTPDSSTQPTSMSWMVLLSLPLLLLCTQQAFRAAANRLFETRLPTYYEKQIKDALGDTKENEQKAKQDAALLSSLPQWSGVFGGMLGGILSDIVLRRTKSRRAARNGVAIVSLALCTFFYSLAFLVESVAISAMLLAVGAFVFSFSSPCAYALCLDISGRHLALVFGMMNMAGNIVAWAIVSSFMLLVGVGGWTLALGVWLSLHVGALLCWLFLNPEGEIAK